MTPADADQTTRPSLAWRLPGDPPADAQLQRMIRVDHAGEYGARRIYAGQLSVLGRGPAGPAIRHMAEQEARHLAAFERLIVQRRVRPTALLPVWHLAGYAMGAATALLGEKAAMACTVAVEEVIDEHYRDQVKALGDSESALKDQIEEFRAEELEHRDTALQAGATEAPAYPLLSAAVKAASRLAIRLSERF
ncbi:ubiquinone biosynthesis monooxygenase Coq7 [Stella humosa]|uniref:3-demethoxyubiquinol 3-hydroxylase n=1 Tax=Stella humosa TaxID=94 RepID=A0A3N1L0I0_9PROT|nr:demethoxyubiquinone hydroxylase family protein [Stella humosa]ROP84450.1 ubiquinone biosynthesis monooxygenase Coq7 [Stella humosa]BBK33968.1 2-nonaprenyl-3-methyl-6-methoxy-1,4-benzoquinol hydroxylase [Stella humosa]